MNKNAKIYIAGHQGMVGSAIIRQLNKEGYHNLTHRTSSELDLCNQGAVNNFFAAEKPDHVFLAAAKVGGILANNTYPAQFISANLAIQANIIQAASETGVKRLLFLGSSCIYPRECPQPIKEEYLLTGPLEPTNRPYAIAKIAGIEMCRSFNRQYNTKYLSLMPTNLYGPGDNFDPETSHVLPAMIHKFHQAKENNTPVTLWGSGTPKREFLHVDDLARAAVFLANLPEDRYDNLLTGKPEDISAGIINIGTGKDITIRELAETTAEITDFHGEIIWDDRYPDGTPRKLMDNSRLQNLGWQPDIKLKTGIKETYNWYLNNLKHIEMRND